METERRSGRRSGAGSLACLGCDDHDGLCATRGCAIIRRSVRALIEQWEKIRELERGL